MRAGRRPHPRLPGSLQPLEPLSRNLRWTWRPTVRALFEAIDPAVWAGSGGNPVEVLRRAPAERLEALAGDEAYLARVSAIVAELAAEDDTPARHPAALALAARRDRVAYFSAEFGLTELLPVYAGGLGVLAGDHLKSASDLAIPLVGVGLFYREGYFRQSLDPQEGQREENPVLDVERLPIGLPETPDGGPPVVTVELGDRSIFVLIRLVEIGRIPLLLLDTHIPENSVEDREITARLYGGDHETRILQEIVLGIGGVRALERLGVRATIHHINEGHAAFVLLEKIRQLVSEEGLTFSEARERAAAGNVFTTHTPVPAGIDRFTPEMLEKYMSGYVAGAGLSFEEFRKLGQENPDHPTEPFSMAVFALRLSGQANAVSQLHAKVSRRLWRELLPELADEDVRIRAITNGVHRPTWTDPEIAKLGLLESPAQADRAAFWNLHERLRGRLIDVCRQRIVNERREQGSSTEDVEASARVLDPKALTIGFARRFATYKRAALILHDPARLARILQNAPVQFVFAGKAHPRDLAGKDLLKTIAAWCEQPDFRGKIVLLPDYDMALARALVCGCDVWLNNPVRPHEASGTSGMKAAMNGVLNLSVPDGWWDEAPYEETGFVIGPARDNATDEEVATSLYEVLEEQVLPLFFGRGEDGLPLGWIEKMIQSASRIGRQFSSERMVTEYLEVSYLPAAERRAASVAGSRELGSLVSAPLRGRG
jgi:glycogen phosphorylase